MHTLGHLALVIVRTGALLAAAAVAGGASATAVYSSAASSTFTFNGLGPGIAPLTHIVENMPSTTTSITGTATASVDSVLVSGEDVHPVTIASAVSGSATAAPASTSSAAAQRGHVIEIDRRGSSTDPLPEVTLRFSLAISWDVHLSVDLPFFEHSRGGAYFAISGFEDGIDSLSIDGDMPGEVVLGDGDKWRWQLNPRYFTSMADVDFAGPPLIITGSITVASGKVGAFSVITDASGSAEARPLPVPSPGTLALALGALPLIAAGRRLRGRR